MGHIWTEDMFSLAPKECLKNWIQQPTEILEKSGFLTSFEKGKDLAILEDVLTLVMIGRI